MAPSKYQPLTLNLGSFSLTEGTSIPAPPDSPPDTPRPPTPGKGPLSSHPTPRTAQFPPGATSPPPKESHESADTSQLGRVPTNDGASSTLSPSSPTGSRRPSSVRKFLGLRSLSSSDSLQSERPGSPGTTESRPKPSLSRKKSGSWFGKRKSAMIVGPISEGRESHIPQSNGYGRTVSASMAPPPQKKGPPAPALPSLSSFGVSEETSNLGADDMFKNIK